jgi:type I restriction enzyme S subunit
MNAIENISLSKVGELRMGETIIEKDCTGEGLPIYSADKSNRPWAYSTHFKRLNQYGTIVLGARGTIGYPRLPKEAVFGATQTTITLRPDSEKFVPEFIYYALQQLDFSLLSAQQAIPMLTVGNLEAVSVPRYPYPEQSKITEVLSKVDQAIEQTEYLIAKQQRIKTGLMQDLLTRGIDEHGNLRSEETHEFKDSPLGRIPVEWEPIQIGKFASLQRGHDITEEQLCDGPFPVVSSSGIVGYHSKATSHGPNVVVGRKGTIGKVHYIPGDFWAHDTSLYVTNFWGNHEKFIYYLFSYFDLARFGTKSGSPSLNRNDIHPLWVGRPSPTEQAEISKRLDQIDLKNKVTENHLFKLRSLKTALMQDLLTGKKRVTPLLEKTEVHS